MAPATGRLARAAAAAVLGFACAHAIAQAITANGLGTTASAAGSNWTIGGGTLVGGNLFHSFGRFNISTGGSATFAGPGTVQNIVSRVTGGERSTIDGQLGSSIAGANVWLINPAGVTFGQNASLNVSGSFHASTASYIRLGDGTVFDAGTTASSLTSAAPAAFGFLGPPKSILVHGSGTGFGGLVTAPGKTLSLVGGDVVLDNVAVLSAPAGRVNVTAAAGPGEVSFGASSIDTTPGLALGRVKVADSVVIAHSVGASPSGSIFIRGGKFIGNDGYLFTQNGAAAAPGVISIAADRLGLFNNTWVRAVTYGPGPGGDVQLDGGQVVIANGSLAESWSTLTGASAGSTTINAAEFLVVNGASVNAYTKGAGPAGTVRLVSPFVVLVNGATVSATSTGTGNAGRVIVDAASKLIMASGGNIDVGSSSLGGNGGSVVVTAGESILMDGTVPATAFPTAIDAASNGPGAGGSIVLTAPLVQLGYGAYVQAPAFSTGPAGSVRVNASGALLMDGGVVHCMPGFGCGVLPTTIAVDSGGGGGGVLVVDAGTVRLSNGAMLSANAAGSADGGRVEVNARVVEVLSAGKIVASAIDGTGAGGTVIVRASESVNLDGTGDPYGLKTSISADTATAASGGTVLVETPLLTASNTSAISSLSISTGPGGSVTVHADRIELHSGSVISSIPLLATSKGGGGKVTVTATQSILVDGVSPIDGEVTSLIGNITGGGGDAGDVSVSAPDITLSNRGAISSSTIAAGDGGNVRVDTARLQILSGGSIDSIGATGKGGAIHVNATESLLIAGKSADGTPAQIQASTGGIGAAGEVHVSSPSVVITDSGVIASATLGDGPAGRVVIDAGRLDMRSGGFISSSSVHLKGDIQRQGAGGSVVVHAGTLTIDGFDELGGSGLFAATESAGAGGSIEVTAGSVRLTNGGTLSVSSKGSGTAGSIMLDAGQRLEMDGSARIRATTTKADAGDIVIRADELVHLRDSEISTSVAGGKGGGGNILIDPVFVVLENSRIIANAFKGQGGNINIVSQFFLQTDDSLVQASSDFGRSGSVVIDSPRVDLAGALRVLPTNFLDASSQLRASCGSRAGQSNSFLAAGRGGIAETPAAPAQPGAPVALGCLR